MVTFQVTNWYTNDYGTSFSIWAPNFEGTVGDTWLIAGALYATLGQQSGEVFPCISTPSTDAAREEWNDRLGSPVPAGSGVPEAEPDPALIAQIEEQRATWLAAGIDDYTAVISTYRRQDVLSDGCGMSGAQLRVTVVDGMATQAIDVMRFCAVDDPSTILLIDDLFDLAIANAGAITDPIEFDPELGYVRSFYASDRSVDTGANVEMFQPLIIDAVVGTEQALDAAEEAMATWEAAADRGLHLSTGCHLLLHHLGKVPGDGGERRGSGGDLGIRLGRPHFARPLHGLRRRGTIRPPLGLGRGRSPRFDSRLLRPRARATRSKSASTASRTPSTTS